MPPVSDYACLGRCKKEDSEGVAPVYELPLGSVRCPKCGSKRLQRIYSAPMVNTMQSQAQRMRDLTRPALDRAEQRRWASTDAAPQNADDWRARRQVANFAVRPEQLNQRMAEYGMHPALAGGWAQRLNVVGSKGTVSEATPEIAREATAPGLNIIASDEGMPLP